jgi:formylglycine-generating enzyme required for sulfatase activity
MTGSSMRHLPPLLLLLLPAPTWADIGGDDHPCPSGQLRNEDTDGECCWPGQAWSAIKDECVGRPECPEGFRIDDAGLGCTTGAASTEPPPPPEPEPPPLEYIPVAPGDYVRIEPGTFSLGARGRVKGRFKNERAVMATFTRAFMAKTTEVTQGEWRRLAGRNPSYFDACGDQCPVERVSWYEALEWLNRLSAKEGLSPCYHLQRCAGTFGGGCDGSQQGGAWCAGDYVCAVHFAGQQCPGYRLPTEAEWEYMARAGVLTARPEGELAPHAWHQANAQVPDERGVPCTSTAAQPGARRCGTQRVGTLKPNAWGLYDGLGNVMEWVWDAHSKSYGRRAVVNRIHSVGYERGTRGGSWLDAAEGIRFSVRSRLPPQGRNYAVGFRPVRNAPPKEDHERPKTAAP